ncbi:hypothetical protein L596_009327 [Steinernema carpocapsae]|uniref:Uncharacterized protein n=1 Tax=Steinernema carpocapsae TaxID=34508 RepID=A0A4V6A6L6_STECR|nr:hypothetical protein L596_009327 [Steinernema carpocapsae]
MELFMFLAQQLVFDVENNGLQSRESLQRIEQCIKGLINSCFQNQRVKETLIREERFMVVIGRILDANPDLATDVCDLIRNLAFHIDPLYHMALSQFVPKLCDNLLRVVNTYHNTQMWNEVGFKNTLDALWNLVAQSKQNKIAICQNPFALKVIIMGMNTTSHEEASGLLRCMRGTLFSHYLTLKPCFDESLFVDYLVNLLYCNSTKSVENVLLLLKDLIPLESPGILNYFRSDLMHIRQMRQQLKHTLCASWNPRISSTARYILEEQVGEQNADLMTEEQEEASTVLYGDCLDPYDDDLLEEFHPPLPDPLTPAINYQFNQGTYELIDLPQLEMGTPKRSR